MCICLYAITRYMYKRSLANACTRSLATYACACQRLFSNTSMRTAPSNACAQRLSTASSSPSSCHATALSDTRFMGRKVLLRNKSSASQGAILHEGAGPPSQTQRVQTCIYAYAISLLAIYLLHIPSLHNRVRETLSMTQRMLPEELREQARCRAVGRRAIDSCVEQSILCARAPARRNKTSRPAWRKPGSSQLIRGRR